MKRKWLRQKEETTKGRNGETARALSIRRSHGSPILRFWDSGTWHSKKDRQSFFQFFETTVCLGPYLAYDKSNLLICNSALGAWLLCALPYCASSHSSTRWRLCWRQYSRGPKRTF